MTTLGPRLWCAVIAVLLCAPHIQCRNVTHEDIRDAMLSLVHMFRTSEDKLERHEYREKALGDQLKKMLSTLDKKHRALEPLKGMISRLDERLSNVETILLQKEEKEKTTQKKTNEALELIQRSIQALTMSLSNKIPGEDNIGGDDSVTRRLDTTDSKIEAVKQEIQNLKNSLMKECRSSSGNPLEKHLTEAEKLLNKYETKLSEYNNGSKVPTDVVTLGDVTLADEAWHTKMTEVMERQEGEIKKIGKVLSDAEGLWKDLPRRSELVAGNNDTLTALQAANSRANEQADSVVDRVNAKLEQLSGRLTATNEDIQRSLTQGNTASERAYNDVTRSYNTLREEVSALSKNEHVLLQTADNVIAARKRVEYGVQQILMEVGELVKLQGRTLNATIHDRFDNIETSIVEHQTGALRNLSSKLESEMSQVWRQIGIMHTQLTSSKTAIDKLTEQTEQYINGSATTMESMKDKVGKITQRMAEVDDNLNYLLGRLSLVVQEFSGLKSGLGDALERLRGGVQGLRAHVEDGEHTIPSSEVAAT